MLDRLDAQDDLLESFAEREEPAPIDDQKVLTPDQRAAIEEQYGEGTIAAAWKTGAGRGNRARLVPLTDGRIVSVYSGGRAGGTYVHEVEHRHGSSQKSERGIRNRALTALY